MASSNSFDFPSGAPLVDENQMVTQGWLQAMTRWHRAILTLYQSGTTLQRPTELLWIGRRFFDTTLGKPVWVKAVKPAVVWVDGVGTVS